MTTEYEVCRSNLEALVASDIAAPSNRNEATTRLQLIDRLFFDCLDWSKDDVVLEEPHGKDYADYTFYLGYARRRVLIVEAKKEGDYFEVPAGKKQLEYSIQGLFRDAPNLKAAMEQAAQYCQSRGVPFAAVSNGHQMVAFLATRSDGTPPLEGKALVFPSLEFMRIHFLKLWQALSKPGVEEKRLQAQLTGDLLPELPAKLSATIPGYPGMKLRNVFQTDLQLVSELVLEDLVHHDVETQFLQECYSQSGALSQYSLTSKAILQARYAALFDSQLPGPTTVPAVDKGGNTFALREESLSRRPILLLGDVGVGKTTFIRHLMKVDAAAIFAQAITFYIDLGSQATLTEDVRVFVLEELERQLREDHQVDIQERNFVRGIYNLELERFGKGIYADLREINPGFFREKELAFLAEKLANREQHLKTALQHIAKGRKKQIILFLDNADQRDDETQQLTFLISQEMAEHWPVMVFVTLRPETFHRSLRSGALSGYHPKAFTISPPRLDRVIEKRLRFAIKLCRGDIPIHALSEHTGIQLAKLEKLLQIFNNSLYRNPALIEFLDNISGGNVRLALDLVKGFFGSGHVDTQKILRIYEESGGYEVPLHEFLRAVIFGDAEYYDPDRSPLVNLFDVSRVDPKEHFLLPLLISLLVSLSGAGTEAGFVDTAKVYERLQGLGFTPEQIDTGIQRGHKGKLLETAARRIPQAGQTMPPALRATTIGIYHTQRLCYLFSYIDAVLVDTPILDPRARSIIREARDIEGRLKMAEMFRQYLDNQWAGLRDAGTEFSWEEVSGAIKDEILFIQSRI